MGLLLHFQSFSFLIAFSLAVLSLITQLPSHLTPSFPHCFSFISIARIKYSEKTTKGETGFILVYNSRLQLFITEKSRWWELEMASHIIAIVESREK